jgi:hypothetical protein
VVPRFIARAASAKNGAAAGISCKYEVDCAV